MEAKKQNSDKLNNQELVDTAREEKLAEEEILRQSLEEKEKLAADYYNQLVGLKAEFENYRKRTEKEKAKHYHYGKEKILVKIVSLLDILEQAEKGMQNQNGKMKGDDFLSGLKLIIKEFHNFLKSEELKIIESVGRKFDPHFHEVVEKEISEKEEEGIILEELQKGYIFNDQVIRPAKVKIAEKSAPAPDDEDLTAEDE